MFLITRNVFTHDSSPPPAAVGSQLKKTSVKRYGTVIYQEQELPTLFGQIKNLFDKSNTSLWRVAGNDLMIGEDVRKEKRDEEGWYYANT